MKADREDVHWLLVIFLGGTGDVPPDRMKRLIELGLVEDNQGGPRITAAGQEALAEFHRNLR